MNATQELFWQELHEKGLVKGAPPESAAAHSPWYIRVMLGISGWIAALFLLGFVAIGLQFITKNGAASLLTGICTTGAAYLIFRSVSNDFMEQFALALSLTGQALFLYGLFILSGWDGSLPWLATSLLQMFLAYMMPNAIQRMLAGYLAAVTLSVGFTILGSPFIVPVLAALAVALFWLNEYSWSRHGSIIRPVAYGLTASLLQLKGHLFFEDALYLFADSHSEIPSLLPQWICELAVGLLLVAVVARLLAQRGVELASSRMILAVLVTGAVTLVSLEAPGISTGLMIILLGFANSNRVLLGLGIASLLFYISAYYYTLQTTLLIKSEILAATGVVLLLARLAVLRWIFSEQEGDDD